MKIPSNKQWTQDNSSDVLGVLGDSTNVTLDTAGKATLAKKAASLVDSRLDADFGTVLNATYYDNQYIILTNDEMFELSVGFGLGINQISNAPNVSSRSDQVVFNENLVVATSSTINTYDGSSWDEEVSGLNSDVPHPLDVFGTSLIAGNGNTVIRYSTGYVVQQPLILPTSFEVTSIRAVGNYIYIATRNLVGGNAKIFIWNGDSALFDYEIEVGASWVFSLTPYQSTVAAITSAGQIGMVSGTSFVELAALPVYHDPHARWEESSSILGKVYNRGMCTVGNTIYINIEGDVDTGNLPDMRGGLWVFDPSVGLYHRATSTSDRVLIDTALTLSGDTLTTNNPHKLRTGDAVSFATFGGLTGVNLEQTYYAKVEGASTLKLAPSRKAIQEERYVKLGGTPNQSTRFVYVENADNGGTYNSRGGFVVPFTSLEDTFKNTQTEVLWSAQVETPDGTDIETIQTFADSYNVGSVETQRIYTNNIDQSWKELYTFLDGLTTDEEEIVLKLQTTYAEASIELDGVWADATTLASNNTEQYENWRDIEEGQEIKFVSGTAQGRTAHVTDIEISASTVRLTLDEPLGVSGQTSVVMFTTFQKIGAYNRTNKEKEKIRSILYSVTSPWIVIKVEMRGFTPSLNMLELSNAVQRTGN